MTNPTEGTMEGLHDLLGERSRYEGWLAQLEARKASTPLHVLERVRADYNARLDHVTTQLRGRGVDLEANAASVRSRLATLASEEEARRDERAETELRASVGEFPPDTATMTIEQCDQAIANLATQRDALERELARLEEVLVLVIPHDSARLLRLNRSVPPRRTLCGPTPTRSSSRSARWPPTPSRHPLWPLRARQRCRSWSSSVPWSTTPKPPRRGAIRCRRRSCPRRGVIIPRR